MSQLFIFTAGNPAARSHLADSINSAVDPDKARAAAQQESQPAISEALAQARGLYAWGAEPGPRNVTSWSQMRPGDHVLCVYDNAYHFAAQVVCTVHDEALAESIWGRNESSGNTSEYMYFLTRPRAISRTVEDLADVLPGGYRGFTRIADHRLAAIEGEYGTLEAFVEDRLSGSPSAASVDAELLTVLRSYQSEGIIFESAIRGRRYRVFGTGPSSATVARVDGGDPETVTTDAFREVAERVRRSGQLLLTEVPGNRLQGATFAQARTMGLAADRKNLIDIESDKRAVQFFGDHIRSLRVDRTAGFARLYKPVILDVVLRAIASGDLSENRIDFGWLVPLFVDRMAELGQEVDERPAAYAFANLAGDVIWLLAYAEGALPLDSSSPSPALLRDRITHACLKDRLWTLLQRAEHREFLHDILRTTWLAPKPEPVIGLGKGLQEALDGYPAAKREPFGGGHPMSRLFSQIGAAVESHDTVAGTPQLRVMASVGRGNWAAVPWIAILASGQSVVDGVYCVYLFRKDMTGVYATFNQGVTKVLREHGTRDGRAVLEGRAERLRRFCSPLSRHDFSLDGEIDLRVAAGLGRNYESSTVAHKFYPTGSIPDDAALGKDLDALVEAYQEYLGSPEVSGTSVEEELGEIPEPDFNLAEGVEAVIEYIEASGFKYEPWHVAQYVTAVRTKPFTILAGITGTGKSKLPALVAEATGSECELVPVRPDWTDSSDVLGYLDLQGTFRPGRLLEVFREAMNEDDRHTVCIIDEMNLARVEQYFAEILSHIEDRKKQASGGFASGTLVSQALGKDDEEWAGVYLPPNLALVGTVNMDESAHGFSRKVLDRAFTLELSDVDLKNWQGSVQVEQKTPAFWPTSAWHPRAIMLGRLDGLSQKEIALIDLVVGQLIELNAILRQGQLQLGYRSRDEIALFVLHAGDISEAFRDRDGAEVDPMDLAIQMKILPRIIGGSNSVRGVLAGLLGWVHDGVPKSTEDVSELVSLWETAGREDKLAGSRFPRSAARLCLMWQRLEHEGFTSFWL